MQVAVIAASGAALLSACQVMELPGPPDGGYTATETVELHLPAATSRLHVTAACQQNTRPESQVSFDVWDSDGKRVQGRLCDGTRPDPGQAPVDGWSNHPQIRFLYGDANGSAASAPGRPVGSMIFTVDAYDANGQFLETVL